MLRITIKTFILATVFLFLTYGGTVRADQRGIDEPNYWYEINDDGTATITRYESNEEDYIDEDSVEGAFL